jgi:deoxyribodipyrimidine photo-lyase
LHIKQKIITFTDGGKMQKYKLSIHVFRRDLRLEDNTALIEALKNSEKLIPCFILDNKQLENNAYRSDNLIEFMQNSLIELDDQLKSKGSRLYLFYGETEKILGKIIQKQAVDAVFFNADYTPFSIKRDESIKRLCTKNKTACHIFHDALINPPGAVLKKDGKPYSIFTPFYKKAKIFPVSKTRENNYANYYTGKIKEEIDKTVFKKILPQENNAILLKGGRKEAKKLLENTKNLQHYAEERNIPSKKETSLLSAHNKFGTVSIREVHQYLSTHLGNENPILTELYWRDFFSHIVFFFPHVIGGCFYEKYNSIEWENSKKKFNAWCEGKTGFPIIDAGMRELNTRGWMHNRVRMITASFLVKDLHIDWRWGEKYFAQKLIDYDPAVNNGNWQWAASTGCDAQPYFRIFNPWTQQKKFDSDSVYIKKWIPELKKLSTKEINSLDHKWSENLSYPKPIVKHKEAATEAKMLFASV